MDLNSIYCLDQDSTQAEQKSTALQFASHPEGNHSASIGSSYPTADDRALEQNSEGIREFGQTRDHTSPSQIGGYVEPQELV